MCRPRDDKPTLGPEASKLKFDLDMARAVTSASPAAHPMNINASTKSKPPAAMSHSTKRFGRKRSAAAQRKSLAAETRPQASQRACVAMSGTAGAEPSVETATSTQDRRLGMAAPQ